MKSGPPGHLELGQFHSVLSHLLESVQTPFQWDLYLATSCISHIPLQARGRALKNITSRYQIGLFARHCYVADGNGRKLFHIMYRNSTVDYMSP